VLNAFTVDVEDYFQVTNFESVVARSQWSQLETRVVANTHRLLELLAARRVAGTFFILGWVADRFPQLVRDIRAAGHELACHSYWHYLVYKQTPDEFRADLRRARQAIEDAAGQKVTAYRAPSFSITRQSLWALEILVEEGFTLDSSIFPTRHDRYGIPGTECRLHRIHTPAGPIWEFPLATRQLGRFSLPVSGGGYFRLYPFSVTHSCLASLNRLAQSFSFYVHPWEVDPQQPRIVGASGLSRFRHYVNLGSTEKKLRRLLASFRFGTMSEVLAAQGQSPQALPTRELPVAALAAER
jgi:polysaccharide deacetylase family protein (PEP-CTERM system associated)